MRRPVRLWFPETEDGSSPQSPGNQSTTGDMGSSVSDLNTVVVDLDDEQHEVVEMAARHEIRDSPTADSTDDPED